MGQLIHIESGLRKIGNTSITVLHRMLNSETGEPAATLENVMLYFDLEAREKVALALEDRERMTKFLVESD